MPELLLSDQGPLYKNQVVRDLCAKWNIRHVFASTYHPESNGLAKQTIGTLKRIMERLADGETRNWKTFLAYAVMAYRIMPHQTTGYSPFKLLYGREALTSKEVNSSTYTNWDSYQEAVKSQAKLIWELHANTRTRSTTTQHVQQAKENA